MIKERVLKNWFEFTMVGLVSLLLVLFQNCGNVSLVALKETRKSSCDPSIYNIVRQNTAEDSSAVYFIQANNYDITQEYSGSIEWYVNGILQNENIVHNNRLHLNCDTHPKYANIKAKFKTDCDTEIEIVDDFDFPEDNICQEPEEEPTPAPPVSTGDFCQDYLNTLSENDLATFYRYYAGNRGLTRVGTTFFAYTGAMLGSSVITVPTVSLPGKLEADKYLALEFTMGDEETDTGKFKIDMGPFPNAGQDHDIVATISPCEGDFRPPDKMTAGDPYKINTCRFKRYGDGGMIQARITGGLYCDVKVGKAMYFNMSLRNLYIDDIAFPLGESSIPDGSCTVTNCGVNTHIKY